MTKRITIAIDGHSACGKSTLARDLAASLNYLHVDSGAMYRATTYFFILNDINPADQIAVLQALDEMNLDMRIDPDGKSTLYFGELQLTEELRSIEVNQKVSEVAAIREVRERLVHIQQKIGSSDQGVVMDGRDIGSVVFPQAELKLFVTASLAVRVERRYKEMLEKSIQMSYEEIKKNLQYRDHIDSTRDVGPLIQTIDAIVLDNSNLTREEQLAMIIALAKIRMR